MTIWLPDTITVPGAGPQLSSIWARVSGLRRSNHPRYCSAGTVASVRSSAASGESQRLSLVTAARMRAMISAPLEKE